MEVKTRRAVEQDLAAIAAINTNVFLGDRDRLESAIEWVQCWWRAFPLYQYFVIEVDGKLAGYAGWQVHGGFNRAEPVVELDQLGIDRAHQSQGLGTTLMQSCIRELSDWMQKKNSRIESHVTFTVWGIYVQLQRNERVRQTVRRRGVRVSDSIREQRRKHAASAYADRQACSR